MIDIVFPCLDEAAALPWVLGRIPAGVRAIVVDNGCTDSSHAIAERHGAQIVDCPQRGYGAACHAGLRAARADLVAFCDCDGSLDPTDVLHLADAIERGADLAVARRRPTVRAAWPLHARIANRELARRVRHHTGVRLHDVGPMRLARRGPLLGLQLSDRRCGYPVETIMAAARAGWRIEQVDVAYLPRIGRSKITGTLRGTMHAIADMSGVLAQDTPS